MGKTWWMMLIPTSFWWIHLLLSYPPFTLILLPHLGSGALLAGSYADPAFGKVTAKSFFEIIPPVITTLAENATYDSMVFVARPNKYYYGDTTYPITYSVYQLNKQITFPLNQSQFYNITDFPIITIPREA